MAPRLLLTVQSPRLDIFEQPVAVGNQHWPLRRARQCSSGVHPELHTVKSDPLFKNYLEHAVQR